MTRIVATCALLAACATYSEHQGIRYPAEPPRALLNRCDRSKIPEAVEVVVAVREVARGLGMLKRWPPDPAPTLCVVTETPWVACYGAGRHLAGCTYDGGSLVLVAERWSPAGDGVLVEHDWRGTLVHEVIAAGAMSGWLDLPYPTAGTEREWVQGERYRALSSTAKERLR